MSGDQIDLDEIETRAERQKARHPNDRVEVDVRTTLALVAEVRRLRAQVERVEKFHKGLVILGNLPIEQREDGLTASVEACAALASDLRVTLDGL